MTGVQTCALPIWGEALVDLEKISCFEAKCGRLRLEESDFWDGPEKRMGKNKYRRTIARGKKPQNNIEKGVE